LSKALSHLFKKKGKIMSILIRLQGGLIQDAIRIEDGEEKIVTIDYELETSNNPTDLITIRKNGIDLSAFVSEQPIVKATDLPPDCYMLETFNAYKRRK